MPSYCFTLSMEILMKSEACPAYPAGKQGSQHRILAASLALTTSVQLVSAHPSFQPNSYLFHPWNWSNPLTFLLPWSCHFLNSAFGALNDTCDSLSWELAASPLFSMGTCSFIFSEKHRVSFPILWTKRFWFFSHYKITVHSSITCCLALWHPFHYKVLGGSQKIVYIFMQCPFECQTKK